MAVFVAKPLSAEAVDIRPNVALAHLPIGGQIDTAKACAVAHHPSLGAVRRLGKSDLSALAESWKPDAFAAGVSLNDVVIDRHALIKAGKALEVVEAIHGARIALDDQTAIINADADDRAVTTLMLKGWRSVVRDLTRLAVVVAERFRIYLRQPERKGLLNRQVVVKHLRALKVRYGHFSISKKLELRKKLDSKNLNVKKLRKKV